MSISILDGKPEVIVRVEIQYHRTMEIKPAVISEDAAWEYVTWDYHESLTMDHGSDTMEHVREIGPGVQDHKSLLCTRRDFLSARLNGSRRIFGN